MTRELAPNASCLPVFDMREPHQQCEYEQQIKKI